MARRAKLRRDVVGRWIARSVRPVRVTLMKPPTAIVSGGRTGARGAITGRFLNPTTSRLQTGGRIIGYQNAAGKFVNPRAALAQTISYLGGQSYDVGALSRLNSGGTLSPTQRGVVSIRFEFSRFNAALTRFLQEFSGNAHSIVRAHALDLLSRIQARTPVRTGRARNSWHMIPPNSSIFRFTYADRTGRSYDGSVEGVKTGPFEAAVATNVEYMPSLEAGHSKQAPQGMVAVSAREKSVELEAEISREIGSAWHRAD